MNRSERRKKVKEEAKADVRKFNQRKSLGTVADKITHQKRVTRLRENVMRVMRQIEAGEVDAIELERLSNFCQWSLALMHLSPPDMLDKAQVHAELLGLSVDNPDTDIIWDPKKLNTLSDGTQVQASPETDPVNN